MLVGLLSFSQAFNKVFPVLSGFSCFVFALYHQVFSVVSCFSSIIRFFLLCICPLSSGIFSCIMFFQYYQVFLVL